MRPRHVIGGTVLLGLACSEPAPVATLTTAHFRFHGELDGSCDAIGSSYELELARLQSALGRTVTEPIDVYVGPAAVERHCSDTTLEFDRLPDGCTVSGTEIATAWSSLSHELVHALRMQHDATSTPFIEEGLATMLGSARPDAPLSVTVDLDDLDHAPSSLMEDDWPDETITHRLVGAHFLAWMRDTYRDDAWRSWLWSAALGGSDSARSSFEGHFGATLASTETRWRDEADDTMIFADLCFGLETSALPPEGIHVSGEACCSDPTVEQTEPGVLRLGRRCFTLSAPTELKIELVSGDGQLVLRPDGCPEPRVVVGPGESRVVTAAACRWQVLVGAPERCDGSGRFAYTITPR